MKFHVVGSYLPQDYLVEARNRHEAGQISAQELRMVEDRAVDQIVDLQLQAGTPSVGSGELRRKYWDRDFYYGLKGIEKQRVDTGRVYQDSWAYSDQMQFVSRIAYNPEHPFFDSFTYLYNKVAGRARCRQTLPSPADLYLTIVEKAEGNIGRMYPSPDTLVDDIIAAYRATIMHLYELGCRSIQLDDSACGRCTHYDYVSELLRGGTDIMQLQSDLLRLLHDTLADLPHDMWKTIYLSSGPSIVPLWNGEEGVDNIMPRVLGMPDVDRFYLPFNPSDTESAAVLRWVNPHAAVALGLISAHTPFPDKVDNIINFVHIARTYIKPEERLSIAPMTGFKLSSYASRGLMFEDQWRKIADIAALARQL